MWATRNGFCKKKPEMRLGNAAADGLLVVSASDDHAQAGAWRSAPRVGRLVLSI